MEDTTQKNQLFYSDNILDILKEVLKKNQLEESSEQIEKKTIVDEKTFMEMLTDVAISIYDGAIKENELTPLIKEKFNLPEDRAQNLLSDIKTQILPLIKRVPLIEDTKENLSSVKLQNTNEPSIAVSPKMTLDTKESKGTEKVKFPPKKISSSLTEKNKGLEPQQKQASGPDGYREPIE